MGENVVTTTLVVQGMTCTGCERRIERAVARIPGVSMVKANYSRGTAQIAFDPGATNADALRAAIEALGYVVASPGATRVQPSTRERALWVAAALLVLYAAFTQLSRSGILNVFPTAKAGMGYGMLFVIGLLTSVHCVAMCGGISLSLCISRESGAEGSQAATEVSTLRPVLRPSLLYNVGRVASYTVVGGIVGALGSVVSFSGAARGVVQLVAGVFMVIMGLNMLNIFPWLRRLNLGLPKGLTSWAGRVRSNSPLLVGLLNGLMPCGPLQAMQLYAMSTGSPLKGALSMLLFGAGTVPLMFGMGALSSVLSKKFTSKMITAGAALVVVMGVFMFSSGMALSGVSSWASSAPQLEIASTTPNSTPDSSSTPAPSSAPVAPAAPVVPAAPGATTAPTASALPATQEAATAPAAGSVQEVTSRVYPGYYEPVTVKAGVPVRWTLVAGPGSLNGCNDAIVIPALGVQRALSYGENVIEFTPSEPGKIPFSCWMGMIRSSITVN